MVEVYCSNIKNPLERVCLKEDLFCPLAKLPEAVEEMASRNGNISHFCLRYLSKPKLIEIEKGCTENLVLSRAMLSPFQMAGRVDFELKKLISERLFSLRRLKSSTRYRLLRAIADDIWQNIFDALMDDPELRRVRDVLLRDFFVENKNWEDA